MLYLAIPAHNEVATIGVLLWRLRSVLAEFPREYEVVVYDDASTDETADVAEQYVHAMPVTVLRGVTSIGYAGAVNTLVRHIAANTRYPRRDAMLLLQADFTDPPGIVPEFARRFEGGADVVVGERTAVVDAPAPVRRLFAASAWALKPFVRVAGVRDLTGSMRLMRISALRDLLRTVGDNAVCDGDSWTANADLLLRLIPHARRVETVPLQPTYGVRTRDSRRVTVQDSLAALRWAWRARGRRAVPSSTPEVAAETGARGARPPVAGRRRDESDVTADRLRERSRERDRLRGESEPKSVPGEGSPARTESQKSQRRQEQRGDPRRKREANHEERTAPPTTPEARPPGPPRANRPSRAARGESTLTLGDAQSTHLLEDPFAASVSPPPPAPVADTPIPSLLSDNSATEAQEFDATGHGETAARLPEPVESEADDDGGLDVQAPTVDEPERKRRRNRRSRRRRSKSDDSLRDAAEVGSPYAVDLDVDGAALEDRTVDDEADGAEHDPEDARPASSDAGSPESADRTKRRGRRGRRGGSRRSRGRGRDAETGPGPAAPPPSVSDAE